MRPNALKGELAPLPPEHPHANLMRNAASAEWGFAWDEISVPTLNITGLCDRVFLDMDVLEKWMARLPDVRRLEWADCGHLIPLERPERLGEALKDFGAEIEAKG